MKALVQELYLTFRRSRIVFFLPLLAAWLLMPAASVCARNTIEPEACKAFVISLNHSFLPLCGTLWGMCYLQMWFDHDGVECMRACSGGRHSCAAGLLVLYIVLCFTYVLAVLVEKLLVSLSFLEFWKLLAELLLCMSALYALTIASRTIFISLMTVVGYNLFCILFSGDASLESLCLIRINIPASSYDILHVYLPLFIVSFIIFVLSFLVEKGQIRH